MFAWDCRKGRRICKKTTTEINDLNDVTGGVNNTKKRDRFGHGPSRERAPSSSE